METQIYDSTVGSDIYLSDLAGERRSWASEQCLRRPPGKSNRRFVEETMRRLNEIAHNMIEMREEGGISNRLMDRGGERRLLSAGYKN